MRKEVKQFGRNLHAIRKGLNITQGELAKKAGLNTSTICGYETGEYTPSLQSTVAIADALDVTIDQLIGRAPLVMVVERKEA